MKAKIIITVAVLALITLLAASFKTTSESPQYATIIIFDNSSRIVIVCDGKAKEMQYENFDKSKLISITIFINKAVNSVASQGYELIAQSGTDRAVILNFIKK